MKPQTIDGEQQSNIRNHAALDLAEKYSLIPARPALRNSPAADPDLHLHRIDGPIAELMCLQTSAAPLFLQMRPSDPTTLPARALKLHPTSRPLAAMTLRQLDLDSYRVLMTPPHGAARPMELDIPAGLPRVINIATLKAMVGAGSSDVVFRRTGNGEHWEICPEEFPVDLQDRTQVFKIREWAILS